MPKRLLLVPPAASCGTLRPQSVSRAACARSVTGLTPSWRAACCASGQRALANSVCCAAVGQAAVPAAALPAAAPTPAVLPVLAATAAFAVALAVPGALVPALPPAAPAVGVPTVAPAAAVPVVLAPVLAAVVPDCAPPMPVATVALPAVFAEGVSVPPTPARRSCCTSMSASPRPLPLLISAAT